MLEIIKKENGISYNDIIDKLEITPSHDNSGYVFLSRLQEAKLITSEKGYTNRKKHYTYKATPKAFLTKEELKDTEDKLTSILKRLILEESISEEEEKWMVDKCQL